MNLRGNFGRILGIVGVVVVLEVMAVVMQRWLPVVPAPGVR